MSYQIESLRLCHEFPAEPGYPRDPWSAYLAIAVDVLDEDTGARTAYDLAAVVGVPEHLRGTMRAAGSGARPFLSAWFDSASDLDDLPRGDVELRDAIESALRRAAWRLYREALDARSDD